MSDVSYVKRFQAEPASPGMTFIQPSLLARAKAASSGKEAQKPALGHDVH